MKKPLFLVSTLFFTLLLVWCSSSWWTETPDIVDIQQEEPIQKQPKNDDSPEIKIKDEVEAVQEIKDEIPLSYTVTSETHTYTQQDLSFTRVFSKTEFPFVWWAMIDIDNDGVEEIYITAESGKKDAMYSYRNGVFVDIIDEVGLTDTQATYGALAMDIEGDGDLDLYVTKDDGVYAYINSNGLFDEQNKIFWISENSVPVDISPADIDNDGDIDLYISTFSSPDIFTLVTFNDSKNVTPNHLLINQWDGTFVDETDLREVSFLQNTFTAIFADLDQNGWQDLVTNPNTDQLHIWMNNEGQFTKVDESSTAYGFWMGMTINDLDGDGDLDVYASNSGDSIGQRFLNGDTTQEQVVDPAFAYLVNDGKWNLTQTIQHMIPSENWFSRGVLSPDLDLDGHPDILMTQNNIKRPPHKLKKLPWEALIYQDTHLYENQTKSLWLTNKAFGYALLQGDVDGNGLDDIIYLNQDSPSRVALHTSENKNNILRVQMPYDLRMYGARVDVVLEDETTLSQYFLPKQWVATSQTYVMSFVLGNYTEWTLHISTGDNNAEREKKQVRISDGVVVIK